MGMSLDDIKQNYASLAPRTGAHGSCGCAATGVPSYLADALAEIPQAAGKRLFGCASPLPPALEGCTVLELGCGAGRETFLAAKLAGANGHVTGMSFSADEVSAAEDLHAEMAEKWGFDTVEFTQGVPEALDEIGIEDGSVDVVIANSSLNFSPDKAAVFSEIWRVLKAGGEFFYNGVFADRRIPSSVASDPALAGKCLSGAMYMEDFRRLMTKSGWQNFRYMVSRAVPVDDPDVARAIGNIGFSARTIRAFKLPDTVEDICEQYGQTAIYRGGIVGCENYFDLDDHHRFFKDLRLDVCGNSCTYVQDTRYGKYFEIIGDRSQHFGPYSGCGNAPAIH